MADVYLVTNNSNFSEKVQEQLRTLLNSNELEFMSFTEVNRPSDDELIDLYGNVVVRTEIEKLSIPIVVFDGNFKDKKLFNLMLGIAAGMRCNEELHNIIIYNMINPLKGFKQFNVLDIDESKELVISNEEFESSEKIIHRNDPLDLSILNDIQLNNINKVTIHNIDNEINFIIIGYCFIRGINLDIISETYDPILSKMGNLIIK